MGLSAVDDVDVGDALLDGLHTAVYLGDHAMRMVPLILQALTSAMFR